MKIIGCKVARFRMAAAAVLLAAALAGCGKSVVLSEMLKAKGVEVSPSSPVSAEIRYLSQSRGTNYLFASIAGGSEDVKTLMECLAACKTAPKPADKQYTPELRCDCEIIITGTDNVAATVLFDTKGNLLVLPDVTKGKDRDTIRYLYYTPDVKLGALVSGLRQGAAFKQDDSIKPFRNMEELKASIDAGELAEEGQELDFEFFSGETPEYTGTACSVYTSGDFTAVPADSCLITAYGKSTAGVQQKLSVMGLEANTNYTKIIVTQPDDALDSIDTGDEAPDAYAIVVKLQLIDPKKWLVFIDDNNRVLDVILPEDIHGLDTKRAPQNTVPGNTDAPSETAEPDTIE